MSDPSDYEAEDYYDQVRAEVSQEAVESFTAERLRSFYDKEPTVAERPFNALAEARRLLETPHHTAAFIHAAIASEVILRAVVLKPILLGFIHTDSVAPFIVKLAVSTSGLERFYDLLEQVFQEVGQLNLKTYRRTGGPKPLWQEVVEIQGRRNHVMHRADVVAKAEAEQATIVATAVMEELFPAFAKSLGYHLHDGFRLCSDTICRLPPEIRRSLQKGG